MATSPKLSLKGYDVRVWFSKNKDSIKQLASILLALLAVSYADNTVMQALFGVGTGAASKLILDGLDFWLSEVKIS